MRVFRHGTCDSTNERAFHAIAVGAALHGDVHLATAQTNGRGRRGSTWWSPQGEGLYASLVISPPVDATHPAPEPASLTMAGGLAALDVAKKSGVKDAWLKWPNDLMVGDRKLAGVLVEARGLDPAKPTYVVGVGLNVRQVSFPDELKSERPVTSLLLEGHDVPLETAILSLLDALPTRLATTQSDPATLTRAFVAATGLVGIPVIARGPDGVVEGTFRDLDLGSGVHIHTATGPTVIALAHVRSLQRA
jgi:BirA family transcriptional regulator, biotin operon repressor / biotin---[acetyl-CoA-carboxylase] ligase